MPRLTSSFGERGPEDIRKQNNRGSQLMQARIGAQNKAPVTMYIGDVGVSRHPRGALFALPGAQNSREYFVIPRNTASNLGTQEGTGVPTTIGFPNDGDYGWWIDAAAGKAYWTVNNNGSIFYATSTTGGINFVDIAGTISDTQHGNRGRATGGNPMHTNATTTEPGFLSTAFFDLLNGATASATASTLVLRAAGGGTNFGGTVNVAALTGTGLISTSGNMSAVDMTGSGTTQGATVNATTQYNMNGTLIINGRDTGWTAMTGTATKGGFDTATVTLPQLAQVVKAFIDAHLANDWIAT